MFKNFQIGSFCFQIVYPEEMDFPQNFLLFENKEVHPTFTYEMQFVDAFPSIEGSIVVNKPGFTLIQTAVGEARYIGIPGSKYPYALYQELSDHHALIFIHHECMEMLKVDTIFTSLLALEKHTIDFNEIVLHCAYIEYQEKAILFSAPSETGKTTQANLWEKYNHTKTINGDRALLGFKDNKWMAHGWPVCGTSEVCHNISMPIKAIVMLSQGKENTVSRLSKKDAFQLLYGQLTVNRWDKNKTLQSMDLCESLLENVPVYHLSCTISKEAVECLQNIL